MDDIVRKNLIEAGCDDEKIAEFEKCYDNKNKCRKLLAAYRRELLDEVHEKERCIDCIDYLAFIINSSDN